MFSCVLYNVDKDFQDNVATLFLCNNVKLMLSKTELFRALFTDFTTQDVYNTSAGKIGNYVKKEKLDDENVCIIVIFIDWCPNKGGDTQCPCGQTNSRFGEINCCLL